MKSDKLKFLSVSVCCFIASLWSESQCMENVSIKQDIEDFKSAKITLIDEQFSMRKRELEERLAHSGRGSGTYAAEARAALERNNDLARQQVNIEAALYGEQLAYLRLNRNIQLFNIQENVKREEINLNLIMYFKAAEQGDASAQTFLGNTYRDGLEVVQSDEEAVAWYRKAANQGFANAQSNLGWMYKNGRGVVQSDAEAVYWYRKAAEQGDAYAQFQLGVLYYLGRGVKKNDMESAVWCRKSAEQGNVTAQFHLGNMYKNGFGVKQSNAEAVYWYRKAAGQGNSEAQLALNQLK